MNDSILIAIAIIAFSVIIMLTVKAITGPSQRLGAPLSAEQASLLSEPRVEQSAPFGTMVDLWPNGRELFFPRVPDQDTSLYEISFTGVLSNDRSKRADAFYTTDYDGNFTDQHHWIKVNGLYLHRLGYESECHDRCEHKYTVRVRYPGERMTLAIHPTGGTDWRGALRVQVAALPGATLTAKEQRDAEKRRQAAEETAHAERTAAAYRLSEAVRKLSIRVQTLRNWGNPEFRDQFARVHCDELIRNQADIRKEATEFLEQGPLVQYLRRHNPDTVAIMLGRLEALLIAERHALQRAISAAEKPVVAAPPKKKLTTEEVRALKVHRQQVQDQDRVALKLDKIETRLQIRERLQQMPLDLDEREMLETELIREIEEGEQDGNAATL